MAAAFQSPVPLTSLPHAAAAVIWRPDGRTLLVRRAKGRSAAGYWSPVTGRPEGTEPLNETARREAMEEVGLSIVVGRAVFGCPTHTRSWWLVWFDATLTDPERADDLLLQTSEVDDACWLLPLDAMQMHPMFESTRRFYERRSRDPMAPYAKRILSPG